MSRERKVRWTGVCLIGLVLVGALLWRTELFGRPLAFADGAPSATAALPPPRRVVVVTPERRTIRRVVRLPADVLAWQEATVSARVTGVVKSIPVDVGTRVEAEGPRSVLAELDVPDLRGALEGARSRFIEASARVRHTKSELETAQTAVRQAEAETSAARATVARMEAEERKATAEAGYRTAIAKRQEEALATSPNLLSRDAVDEARGKADVAHAATGVASAQLEEAKALAVVAAARESAARSRVEAADASVQEAKGAALTARVAIVEAETALGFATLKAPFAGIVTQRWVDVGDLVRGASADKSAVVRVVDASKIRVRFRVAAPDAPSCKPGNAFRLVVDELPGQESRGVVARTAESLDVETRTMRTEGDLDNAAGALRPGMFGRVFLDLEPHEGALSLPAEAITTVKRKSSVLVVADGKVVKRPVKIGADDGVWVEIVEGLKGSEAVITTGGGLVSEGERVESVPESGR